MSDQTRGKKTKASVQLAVDDLNTTEAFYVGLLEIPARRSLWVPGAPELLTLYSDGWEFIFVEAEAVARNHPVLEERFELYPKGVGMTLHFSVTDLDGIYAAILEEDLDILYPLEVKPYGTKELWVFDPDGYLVVLEEPRR